MDNVIAPYQEIALNEVSALVDAVVEQARALSVINSDESFQRADGYLVEVKKAQRTLEAKRKEFTLPIDQAKKKIMDDYRPKADALSQAEMILKGGTRKWWIAEQERKAREERARQEEARKAEEERVRKEQIAMAAAEALEKEGKAKEADKVITEAAKPVYKPTPEKVKTSFDSGRSYGKEVWKCEVVDPHAFLRDVASGLINLSFVEIKVTELNRSATAHKGEVLWPGIKVTKDVVMGVR